MIVPIENDGIELRSNRFGRIFAGCGSVFFCMAGLSLIFDIILRLHRHLKTANEMIITYSILGIFYFLAGMSIYWRSAKFRLFYNSEGIGQSDGFRNVFIKWENIESYTMEQIGSSKEKLTEPVFRDADGNVIFRPFITKATVRKEERAEFWKKVTAIIDNKK